MKTKLFLLMAIVLFACSTAKAYDALIDGIYYEFYGDHASVTHVSENDEGPISNYSGDIIIPSTITYNGTAYTVQTIGNSAFYECTKLTSVAIPNSVIAIDNQAFYGCDALTSIIIPEGVTTIYSQAIHYCSNLKSVKIPNSVTSIGTDNFSNCLSLTDVYCYKEKIPETEIYNFQKSNIENVTLHVPYGCKAAYEAVSPWNEFGTIVEMEPENPIISFADAKVKALCVANWDTNSDGELDEAEAAAVTDLGTVFEGNTEITSFNELQYFTGLTSIGDYAFQSCSSLTTVNIPNSVTSIGEYAFYNCFGLTSITIGNGVAIVGEGAFNQCVNLGKVNITDLAAWCNINFDKYGANPLYHAHHLYLDGQEITDLVIPNSVTNIGSRAFYGCSITSVTIPNSVTRISDAAFYYCDRLTSIAIPNSVTSISRCTFEECINLTSVTIPSSVTNIGTLAFHRCRELADVYCYAQDVPSIESNDVFFESGIKDAILHVPYGCKAAYEAAATWNEFGAIVEMEPENPIISFADAKVKALCVANWDTNSDGELDEAEAAAVTDLGTVFKGNTEITSFNELKYFAELTTIGIDAFYGCSHLASIAIPSSLTMVKKGAFRDCQSLSKVIVSDIAAWCGIIYDGDDYNGDFPLGIAHHLYSDEDTEITELVIPEGVTKIEARTFRDAQYITSVTIPNSVTTIEAEAFRGMTRLESINIPEGVTSLEPHTFHDCQSLASINIPNKVTSIGYFSFSDCHELTSATIGSGVVNIENDAFRNCEILRTVTLESDVFVAVTRTPETSMKTIFGEQVEFYIVGDSVNTIGDYAFCDCDKMTTVTIGNNVAGIGTKSFSGCSCLFTVILESDDIVSVSRTSNMSMEAVFGEQVKTYIIGDNVSNIGQFAFCACTNLHSVNIGTSVTSIGYMAFSNCPNLSLIKIASGNTRYDSRNDCNAIIETTTNSLIVGCKSSVIPETVTGVHGNAFIGTGLTSIFIPESIIAIVGNPFQGCSNLTSIKVAPENSYYDSRNDCNAIIETSTNTLQSGCKSSIIPNSVISIGSGAFNGSLGLVSIAIPNSVTSIGGSAFAESGLISIDIPQSVTNIRSSTFCDCRNLVSVTIPDGVTTLEDYVFLRCSSLESIIIPNSVTSIGRALFEKCSSLTHVSIGSGVSSINDMTFSDCVNLSSITIPNSITTIGAGAFNGSGLTTITIPNSVTSIGGSAFARCFYLSSITLPDKIKTIEEYTFHGCDSLRNIDIPKSVTSIGNFAFEGCTGLADIYCYAKDVPNAAASYAFYNTPIDNTTLHVPYGCKAAYKASYPWNEFGTIVEMEPESPIISFADAKVKALCVANWDKNSDGELDEAEAAAVNDLGIVFKENTEITSFNELQYFTGLTAIGEESFWGCDGLTSAIIPNSVSSIGNYAFQYCSSLTSINIPTNVISIGEEAFYQCSRLVSITIPKSVNNIKYKAFSNCISLTSIKVDPDNKTFDSRNDCNAIIRTSTNALISGCKNTNIPNNVTSIDYGAFYGCRDLTSITIPNNVIKIEDEAFWACSNLTSINIPANVISIGEEAFQYCSSLTCISIPYNVKSIGVFAFGDCVGLKDVYCLAENVPNTSNYAFDATPLNSATLHVPYGCKAAYEAASPWNEFGKIVEIPIPITIGETGFATFCSPYALDFSEVEDIRAYIVSGFNQETGTLVLTRVTEVPAGEGLYIAGMPGNHEIPQTQTSMFYANLLKGVTEPTIISPTDGNYTNYILSNGSYGVGFYTLSQTGTLDAGKAYLQLPTASVAGIKALKIEFDENDDPTGIAITSTSPAEENTIYNLAGQRVSKAHRGINIVNGKKVFIK